ncbi:MAG: hypothetical protein ACI9TP_002033 [Candidatus Azotimanducaceae bacterium]
MVNVTATQVMLVFQPAIYTVVFGVYMVRHVSDAADVGCDGVFIKIYQNDEASTFNKKRLAMARPIPPLPPVIAARLSPSFLK